MDTDRQGEQHWKSEMPKDEQIIELEKLLIDIKLKLKVRQERLNNCKKMAGQSPLLRFSKSSKN